jgi:hypothetical protein
MDMGFAISLPARPAPYASDPVLVHRLVRLLHASFRPRLATTPLRFAITSPPSGCEKDFHLQLSNMLGTHYSGVALNPDGRKIADAWDPAKDEAAGEQCRSYGAPNIMQVPGRLHITWPDEQTLKIETDAGMQARLFHFTAAPSQAGGWQGVSNASWDLITGGRGQAPVGSLKVVTTSLKPGYLRKNGVPYSANAVLTEYFDRVNESNGDAYLVVTTTVEDPTYLTQPLLTASLQETGGWVRVEACAVLVPIVCRGY